MRSAKKTIPHSLSVGIGAAGPGGGATAEIVMLKFCVASGAVPFVAVTVPPKVPTVVGVPLITPTELKLNPGGRLPAVTLKVGEPVEV
jgi:hypothetical protein